MKDVERERSLYGWLVLELMWERICLDSQSWAFPCPSASYRWQVQIPADSLQNQLGATLPICFVQWFIFFIPKILRLRKGGRKPPVLIKKESWTESLIPVLAQLFSPLNSPGPAHRPLGFHAFSMDHQHMPPLPNSRGCWRAQVRKWRQKQAFPIPKLCTKRNGLLVPALWKRCEVQHTKSVPSQTIPLAYKI